MDIQRALKMRITRFHLLLIMVFCLAVIAIVTALSLYVPGSHDWEFDSGTEKCGECHDEIKTEIESMPAGSPHLADYNAGGCSFCHVNYTIGGSGNHSGLLIECQDCHPITEPERDGDAEYGTLNFTSPWEAHKPLYDDLTGTDHDPGKNKACMACHTRVDVIVRFNRPQWYNFTIGADWNVTLVESGPQFVGGNYTIQYTTSDLGKHYFVPYRNCSSPDGCHQDVEYSRTAGGTANGISGGHQSNISAAHPSSVNCTYCHWGEDPTKDFHAARRVNCTYSGCHSPVSSNMTTLFTNIDTWVGNNSKGDLCWGCHSGFDFIDAGTGLKLQVETERNYNVSWWTGSAWQKIYPDDNINCSSCHNDSLPNVPPIPFNSSKYIDHDTTGNYSFGADGSSGCLNCHDEAWAPHDNPHDINISYIDYRSSISNSFCNTSCHYSVIDSRPSYADQTTWWMKDITTSFETANSLHATSTLINSTGSTKCWDCHPEHEFMPDDGGLSVPGCGATNLNVSCHVPDQGWGGNKTDTPSSHGSNWVVAGRNNCIKGGCHDQHNYSYDPSAGHDPKAGSCHGTGVDGGCDPGTNSHPKHIESTFNYDFDCGECHYDNVSNPSESDGTFGTALHNNGVVNVNFDNTSNGVVTYRGNLTGASAPTYEGGNGSCSGTYCHSNGYGVGGINFKTYESPDWSGGTVICGDCHGVPNYYNGTAWRELGGNVTNNSIPHLKHTRNYGGINSTRYLYWFDNTGNATDTTPPYGWRDSIYDSGEAIIQDLNNNRMLDYGVLNGTDNQAATPPASPDNVYVAGKADLRDFATADALWYDDANTDGNWDRNEDIYKEMGGGGNKNGQYDAGKDGIVYNGTDGQQLADGDPGTILDSADDVMYLDSDHDDLYDAWYGDSGGYGLRFSGVDEPIIYTVGKATGDDLEDTDEVLKGAGHLPWFYADFNRWYSFDCSECHYNNPPTQGWGTYNTSKHVNADRDIAFDTTSNGIASKNGTYAANASAPSSWAPSTQECYGIWCHSDGYTRDATNGSADGNGAPDWSGDGIQDDQYNNFLVEPAWTDTNRTTVFCGSCHYSWDKPADASSGTDRPNTGGHRRSAHNGQSQFPWHGGSDATPCMECHWRWDTFLVSYENAWWRPYGSDAHVDAGLMVGPDSNFGVGRGLFGILSESQSYGDTTADKCHNNWPSSWRSGYSNNGC